MQKVTTQRFGELFVKTWLLFILYGHNYNRGMMGNFPREISWNFRTHNHNFFAICGEQHTNRVWASVAVCSLCSMRWDDNLHFGSLQLCKTWCTTSYSPNVPVFKYSPISETGLCGKRATPLSRLCIDDDDDDDDGDDDDDDSLSDCSFCFCTSLCRSSATDTKHKHARNSNNKYSVREIIKFLTCRQTSDSVCG